MESADPCVFCLEQSGLQTAEAVTRCLGATLVVKSGVAAAPGYDVRRDFAGAIRECFAAGVPVIGVCAAGILIRTLAPLIRDKRTEPPVVCVAEDGSSVAPLLGGHAGGNAIARRISEALSAVAAITTASELRLGVALDAPPDGWRLENPLDVKEIVASILSGREVVVSGGETWLNQLRKLANVDFTPLPDEHSPVAILVPGVGELIYRRADLALGVGAVRNCPADSLISLALSTLADAGLSRHAVEAVYSIDLKSDEAAVHALARELGVEARFFPAEALELETERLKNPSETVYREVGCHGVCEASALAAAGPFGTLLAEKQRTQDATCAVARIGEPRGGPGKRRGTLCLVGLGPGGPEYRTSEANRMLAEAEELVGYEAYLDMIGGFAAGKTIHRFAIGEEEQRCRFALELAGEGKSVALVCSGDAGIYAMAALVMELLDRQGASALTPAARRVEIASAAGITAMQAASARAGAILGHDFCAVSLSDLLTSREDILRRVRAAGQGDFVVAFYNPVSRNRRQLLKDARDILLDYRPGGTPVLIAHNLGRDGERLRLETLDGLVPDGIDMTTVVIVGSSNSRLLELGDTSAAADGRHIYTPRGYGSTPGGNL